jgi:hypothetical protein
MRQEDDDRRGRHIVAALNVHVVFVTKDRRGLLTGEHLGILGLVNSLKGVSARWLRPTLPGAHPPGTPVVPVVFRGLGW